MPIKSEITGVLKGLGFEEKDFEKQVSTLSGGQKTPCSSWPSSSLQSGYHPSGRAHQPLDMESIAWLETYLLNYPGAVFIVSHDRYFLDKVVTKIVELDNTKATVFHRKLYRLQREKSTASESRLPGLFKPSSRRSNHQEEVIAKLRQFNREKSIRRAESREKMLEKMDVLEKPQEIDAAMRISLKPRITSGNDVLMVRASF